MNKHLLQLILGFIILIGISACKHEPTTNTVLGTNLPNNPTDTTNNIPCDSDIVYFNRDILPLLISNCAYTGCHDAATAKEEIVLNSYANVMRTGGIVPFNAGNSKIYKKVIDTDPKDVMPPAPKQKLTTQQIETLAKWINQGASNIQCNYTGCDTTNVNYTGQISSLISANCLGCHSGSAPGGNISLTNYAEVKSAIQQGKLLGAIEHSSGFSAMPKGGQKLDECKITIFKKWQALNYPQ
ncbi:MAG: c-type cytochrome domain-containing protein [Bacteroidia bacterium]|jgi:cytochrome c5